MSNLDELLKLKELLDLGIINENDFKRKKAELFSDVNIGNEDSDSIKKEEIIIGINEKECPSCKCIIEKESESCNFCDYDFINNEIREEINYPIKSNNNLKKYISIFFLVVVFIFLGTWFFIANNSSRGNELELKNHKTEVENYQYELQQKEIEEQKRMLLEQKQKEAERISNDTTLNFSNSEAGKIHNDNIDEIQDLEEKHTSNSPTDNTIYNTSGTEVKPDFPGGIDKFYRFVGKNFNTPEDESLKGKVLVSFVVEKDGSLSDIKVLKDIGFGTGQEAIRVLKLCPRWSPAQKNGNAVRCIFSLPISIESIE